ncbi:BatD family protein [Fulvimonas yonginensis]|uniref:BatD family protein n=1 Tax=Fulvimonas yonginensis TaxID=1495200 RepID=A0ABU8J931_9GAMM
MKRLSWLGLWLVLLSLPVLAGAAHVSASLDRSQVQLGETVTLNLRADGSTGGAPPDLGALAGDFDVLGSSSNTSVSIVDGRRSVQFIYGVALRPKHVGRLSIPALDFAGGRTRPLTLTVVPPDPSAAADTGKDVFLEATAEPTQVRVGQQLLFTVRLYFAGSLSRGSLEDPQLPGIDARRLGNDLDYEAIRGGRAYHVIERRYAVIPQRAGKVTLPPLQFEGELLDPTDPDSFFAMGSPTTAASPPVTLDVQPVPPGWGSSAWLPARALDLTLEGLPADGRLRVGQPLQLTMAVQATGLPYEALPALSLPRLDGATVYPDKPVTSTRNDGRWLTGRRQQDFAVVPDRPGTLVIPAVTLKWWNVQSGQAEVARIPAHTLAVLPSATTDAAAPVAPPAAAASARAPVAAPVPAWREVVLLVITLVLAGGALGLLGGWLWRRRRAAPVGEAAPSTRSLRAAFLAAARGGDATAQAQSLLAWARAERPGLSTLGALAEALDSPVQCEAIERLQRRRFAGQPGEAQPDLADAFREGFRWRAGEDPGDPPLPPLYPFKLR